MNKILTSNEITKFKKDGAVFLKGKFDKKWIEKLKDKKFRDAVIDLLNEVMVEKYKS